MGKTARMELDNYLRRTIQNKVPVGGGYSEIGADQVFATLSTFGLRLEDRGLMADAPVFLDGDNINVGTIRRLQNYARHYYTARTNKFEVYWEASAIETLVELARYRGLWAADGFLTPAT